MTDQYNAITVVLERDIRDDDAEFILNAIRMIRGVLKVTPHVADHTALVAEMRAKHEMRAKVLDLLKSLE